MELFSIRIRRTFQLVSTVITEERSLEKMFPLPALGHANNKQTHNYGKPIFTLLQMRIINSKEINAISRLSGYKKLNGCTWLKNTHHML